MNHSQGIDRKALHFHTALVVLLIASFILAACSSASARTPDLPVFTPTTSQTTSIVATEPPAATSIPATLAPSPTAPPVSLWLPEFLPEDLRAVLNLPQGWFMASSAEQADVWVDVVPTGTTDPGFSTWIYALVTPFPTITDGVQLADLQNLWKGGPVGDIAADTLLVDAPTRTVFKTLWGPESASVQVVEADKLVDTAWASKSAWAIVPFERLEPRWKVLEVDGQPPIQKSFQPLSYPLKATFTLQGDSDLVNELLSQGEIPSSNRDPNRLTTVMLTGVTAMVRGTASLMEVLGMTYPDQGIRDWLREADILHISNEVPFAKNCPQPFDWQNLVFCSQTEYIQLLEDVGTDVVELTGDHFADWGPEAMLYTLDLYKERGWKYYGGGANLAEAQQPALFEHNGNKIAFLGCNAKDPGYARASATEPGAGHCDFDELTSEIKKVRQQGYLPIVTFQHLEYYQYIALPQLQEDFHKVADAGAVIVSGSQAHQPHAFEYRDGALLHYGLGNLFFDQTNQGDPSRTAFIDRHVFYNGRYISTELLTIYFVDYARSRPMTQQERQEMLKTVFQASGW